jgi:hypothetical protein
MKVARTALVALVIAASHAAPNLACAEPPAPPASAAAANLATDPVSKRTELGGVTATVRFARSDFEVGQPIACTITFEGADAATIAVDPAQTLGDFDIVGIAPARRIKDSTGAGATELDVTLMTFDSGTLTPAELAVSWRHGSEGNDGKVAFPALSIKSLLGEKVDPSQFRDIAGEVAIASPLDGWPWAAGAGALLVLGVIAWVMLRKRPTVPVAPDVWALGEFTRLESAALPAKNEFGLYYDELTRIVRAYIARRYAIPADRQTSREFIAATQSHAEFPSAETDRLRALLRLADLVKFAKAEPSRDECDRNLAEARGFVESTRPTEKPEAEAAR